jgi:hypothetical protein
MLERPIALVDLTDQQLHGDGTELATVPALLRGVPEQVDHPRR